MKISDFLFVKTFIQQNELLCDPETEVDILWDGKKDARTKRGNIIEIHNPTSISKMIFNILLTVGEENIKSPHKFDIFSLSVLEEINNYVYATDENFEIPLLMSGCKLHIPTIITKEIIEPILDKEIPLPSILLVKCPITDPCRLVRSYSELGECVEMDSKGIPFTKYPLVLRNSAIHNTAASDVVTLIKFIELAIGPEKIPNLIKNILINEGLMHYFVQIAFQYENDPFFVDSFLRYFKSYANLSEEETVKTLAIVKMEYESIPLMEKFATNYNMFNDQWNQWGGGLIEKMLGGARGSKQETTQSMKPFADEFEKLKNKYRKRHKKRTLSLQDLLEVQREDAQTTVAEPGKLHELLLQENRNW